MTFDFANFIEFAKARKTTYSFQKKPVPETMLSTILETGRWSPSCSNMQPWHFVVVTDENVISRLIASTHYGKFKSNPPVLVAITLDKVGWVSEEHPCVLDERLAGYTSLLSIAMPALNMSYSAISLGLGSCIITPEPEIANQLLEIPAGKQALIMVGVGFEKASLEQKNRERKQLDNLVSYEKYGKT